MMRESSPARRRGSLVEASPPFDLVEVVQELSLARTMADIQRTVGAAARRLSGADGATFVLRERGTCHYVDEDAISPLWKGLRFSEETCVSGWAMQHREPVVIPDITVDARVPQDAYRATFVKSLLMTPIRSIDPIGAIGVYWASPHEATDREVATVRALADSTAVAIESVRLWAALEERVAERTAALAAANERLATEVRQRTRAEARVRRLSLTDELTGLYNRRGFMLLADRQLQVALRTGSSAALVFADVDRLKAVNDTAGHEAGSALLVAAADALRRTFREIDVIARLGGDEFAMLHPNASDHTVLQARLEAEVDARNAAGGLAAPLSLSVGIATAAAPATTSLTELLATADAAMYRAKRARDRDRSSAEEWI